MKFSTRHDVDVPAERLFDAVVDFDRIERVMVRRGARVQRADPAKGFPMAWNVAFTWRGQLREMALSVRQFDRPEAVVLRGEGEAFDMTVEASVVALSRRRSRLLLLVDLKPRTMKARLLLQSARLTKARLDKNFADRIGEYVADATAADLPAASAA